MSVFGEAGLGLVPQLKLCAKHTPAEGFPRIVLHALSVGETVHALSLAAFRF